MVGVEYVVTYDRAYTTEDGKCPFLKTIHAKMVNDYPSKYVFENEFGRYVFPHNAIHNMYPIDEESIKCEKEVVDTYLDMFLRGEICVRCKTEDDARKLLSLLHKHGYKWTTGTSLLRETCWEVYDYNTAYYMKDGLSCGRCSFFKEDKGLEVVDYQDFVKSI